MFSSCFHIGSAITISHFECTCNYYNIYHNVDGPLAFDLVTNRKYARAKQVGADITHVIISGILL